MSHEIKVKDTSGNTHTVPTTQVTTAQTTQQLLAIAAGALGVLASTLTIISHGKVKV